MLFEEDIHVISSNTCYILSFADKKQIIDVDLPLKTGESLKVGDAFVQLGRIGCSYKYPILMSDGWVQIYVGAIDVIGVFHGKVTRFFLFSAIHESGECGLSGVRTEFENRFIAYVQPVNFKLAYYCACERYRFFETDYLVRASCAINQRL